ncbi:piggyBac transposable element-derived protein 4 [Trichonephila clavipes]|nr:piggyBac transposable element-derived protein 4 [Trichonephila clavipes]
MDRFLEKAIVSLLIIFMSPHLADILVTEKTVTYRTVNKTRKDLPVNFSKDKVPKDSIAPYQRGKVMALMLQDKKSVCLLSTIHYARSYLVTCKSKKTLMKPVVVCDYNNTTYVTKKCPTTLRSENNRGSIKSKFSQAFFRSIVVECLCTLQNAKPKT